MLKRLSGIGKAIRSRFPEPTMQGEFNGSPEIKVLLNTTWKRQQFERRVFVLSSLVYGVIVLLLLGLFMTRSRVVVLTPPQIKEKLSISRSTASGSYCKEMALFLTQLVGNLSPDTVDYALDAFSSYLDPSVYESVTDSLADIASVIKEKQTATAFYPEKVGEVGGKWYVVGKMRKSGQKEKIKRGEEIVTYEIKFKIRSFRIYIAGFEQHNGDTLRKAVQEAKRQH